MPSVICSASEFKRELHNSSHNWLSAVVSVCRFEHHSVLYDMTYGNCWKSKCQLQRSEIMSPVYVELTEIRVCSYDRGLVFVLSRYI